MRDDLANIQVLIIPGGATTGQRIVIDGIAGTITVYDSSNAITMRFGIARAIELSSGDASESSLADIQSSVLGAGSTRRLSTVIESPTFSGRDKAIIDLNSESFDGTIDALIRHTAITHQFDGIVADPILKIGDQFSGDADIQLANRSLPRGVVDYVNVNGDVALSATAGTYTTLVTGNAITCRAGRLYRVTCIPGAYLISAGSGFAASDTWRMKLERDIGSGFVSMARNKAMRPNVAVASVQESVPLIGHFSPSSTTSATFRARAAKTTGAGTVTSTVSVDGGEGEIELSIEDIGPSSGALH